MSDGLSIQHRRITKSCFRTCSSYRTRSQAPFYLYARCLIANQAEGTFELLRYSLGGDRPSQTAHLALSAARIHGTGLEFKHNKAGVSASAPKVPENSLHSLPATLRMLGLNPILSYSKGSRGLSVILRVRGIFTTTTISPGHWLRQCISRYAIHAGRNLPDKELRYLRTVIVTAAVYRSFGCELHLTANPLP